MNSQQTTACHEQHNKTAAVNNKEKYQNISVVFAIVSLQLINLLKKVPYKETIECSLVFARLLALFRLATWHLYYYAVLLDERMEWVLNVIVTA